MARSRPSREEIKRRKLGRELAMMAICALEDIPPSERAESLREFWKLFQSKKIWEVLMQNRGIEPSHPLDVPPLWKIFDEDLPEEELDDFQKSAIQFAEYLINGYFQNQRAIDERISKKSKRWRLHRMAKVDRAILRMASFEILYSKDVPEAVVINEAIELSKVYSTADNSPKFINGILANINK